MLDFCLIAHYSNNINQTNRRSKMTQAEMDTLYEAFCEENGIVMDTDADRADYAARGHLYSDPGSDVHDFNAMP